MCGSHIWVGCGVARVLKVVAKGCRAAAGRQEGHWSVEHREARSLE